ncbi:MAG: uL22 family ribosomal protein [Candidatus Pacearchaeota archaeon]|jgi:large subunit ribosomal protein L22
MADEQLKQQKIVKDRPMKERAKLAKAPIQENKKEAKERENKEKPVEENKVENVKHEEKTTIKNEEKKVDIVGEVKKKKEAKVKKSEAAINAKNLNISLKHSIAICKFVKYKKIDEAINLLEKVVNKKIAIPFKGEIPHRKGKMLNGKGMMSGRYPVNASKVFIRLLKELSANANSNGMDLEITKIIEAVPNKAPAQYHRFGSTQFKRTHVSIKAKEIQEKKKDKKDGGKK